jgi:hypothetical protein
MSFERYLPVQARADLDTSGFIISANLAIYLHKATIAQDAGRSIDLVPYTLFTKVAASNKWRSFVTETATNGTAIPQGIYVGPTVLQADIVDGDVENAIILRGGFPVEFDEEKLIIENSKLLETVIDPGTIHARTIRDYLFGIGLIARLTTRSSRGEN